MGVKNLVCPHNCYQVTIAGIAYRMHVSGRDVHDCHDIAAYRMLNNFCGADFPKANEALAAHNQKFLGFQVMPMVAFGYAGLGDIYGYLPMCGCF